MAFEEAYGDVVNDSEPFGIYDEVSFEYGTVLGQLLPPGPAWDIAPDGNFEKLLYALGHSFERVLARGKDLLLEFDPATMTELLEDWERVLGLPGDNPNPPTTIGDRRNSVLAKLLGNGDPNAPNFQSITESLGYQDVEIVSRPLDPFVAGSPVGDPLWNSDGGWPWVWLILCETTSADALLAWTIAQTAPLHGKVLITHALLLSEPFETWTGSDPDGWTVTESGTGAEVSEVGSGEAHGGTGTGAVNLYLPPGDPLALVSIQLTTPFTGLTPGDWFACIVDVSYSDGDSAISDNDTPSAMHETMNGTGRYAFFFAADDSDITPLVKMDAQVSNGQITIDRIRYYGPLELF